MSWGGGRKCGAFLSTSDRDPHPTCARCRGKICTRDMTCDFCADWSSVQWELFIKKRSYKEKRIALQALFLLRRGPLPARKLLREFRSLGLPPLLFPTLQVGRIREGGGGGSQGAPGVVSREASSPPARPRRGVGVYLDIRLLRASAPLPLQLLRELGRWGLLGRSGLPWPAPLPRLLLPVPRCTFHDVWN